MNLEEEIQAALTDLPKALAIVTSVKAALASLPPASSRKATDYASALGLAPNTPGYLTAELIDQIESQIKTGQP